MHACLREDSNFQSIICPTMVVMYREKLEV